MPPPSAPPPDGRPSGPRSEAASRTPSTPSRRATAPSAPGRPRAALRHATFRRVFIGAFLSNIGSWMQNVVLGALAYDLTKSPSFVGVLLFAQLGPLLLFSLVGGLLADAFDRRRLLVTVSVLQGLLSLALAWVARVDDPSKGALVGIVFLIGIGQAVFGPTYSALLPALVGREDLAGAISLNSAQMNGSRVIGPVIGSALYARFGADWVFIGNAASYLLVIWSLLSVRLPEPAPDTSGLRGLRRLGAGFAVAQADRVVARCLDRDLHVLAAVAAVHRPDADPRRPQPRHRGQERRSTASSTPASASARCSARSRSARSSAVGSLEARGAGRAGRLRRRSSPCSRCCGHPLPAYAVDPARGARLLRGDHVAVDRAPAAPRRRQPRPRDGPLDHGLRRHRPIGNLIAGPLIEATSITTVVLAGAAIAVALAWYADLDLTCANCVRHSSRRRRAKPESGGRESSGQVVWQEERRQPLEAGDAAALDQHGVAVAELAERRCGAARRRRRPRTP